jgi:citrate lyase beta subunit
MPTLDATQTLDHLAVANQQYAERYPGESTQRQPLHTVYGGAQLYRAETTRKLGQLALRHLDTYAPTPGDLRDAVGIPRALEETVYARVRAKLEREAVEDFRIDFEDGYGNRPDAEEDETAMRTAREVARGMAEDLLPPFIGIRIKPLNEELKHRSVRTLDLFVTTLLEETGGRVPDNFVITLPKIPIPAQVTALADLLDQLENAHGLASGTLKIELMIELTQTLFAPDGRSNLPLLAAAARGRCTGAHFGTYDYTASCSVTADQQRMDHPVCDFAKHMMQVAYAGTGIFLSDGATNVMPVGPHRGSALSAPQLAENRRVVHQAWKLAYDHVQHSLRGGFYQGWDLHPGQLPIRYAAGFAFFLEGLDSASERLHNFVAKAAQATLVGDVFDDAATGQGLLNYFLRALNSGACTMDEIAATGLTLEEIQGRSFVKILEGRRT